jgi:hypothetical protein
MESLFAKKDDEIRLTSKDTQAITWYIDSAFADHNNYRS